MIYFTLLSMLTIVPCMPSGYTKQLINANLLFNYTKSKRLTRDKNISIKNYYFLKIISKRKHYKTKHKHENK